MRSMTGFARAQGADQRTTVTAEIRAVNGRKLEMSLRYRDATPGLTVRLEQLLRERVDRGRVESSIEVRSLDGNKSTLALDTQLATSLYKQAREFAQSVGGKTPDVDWIFSQSSVWGGAETVDVTLIERVWADAVAQLLIDREREGEKLRVILKQHAAEIRRLYDAARAGAASSLQTVRQNLRQKVTEMLDGHNVDNSRIEQEIVHAVMRADVAEEVDRIGSHLEQLDALLNKEHESVGRALDFLAQEFLRESNTLCSKAATNDLKQTGLQLKEVVDRLREQVQNVE